jgi:hypothetical protein
MYLRNCTLVFTTLTSPQTRRSPMRTWASVSSTKRSTTIAKKKVAALWTFPRTLTTYARTCDVRRAIIVRAVGVDFYDTRGLLLPARSAI